VIQVAPDSLRVSHPCHNSVTPSIHGCGMAKGSVQRKGRVWSFVVDLGPDPASGRRRQARRSGFATKKAAEAALRSLATASDAGTAADYELVVASAAPHYSVVLPAASPDAAADFLAHFGPTLVNEFRQRRR
jgi:hypothetical protein